MKMYGIVIIPDVVHIRMDLKTNNYHYLKEVIHQKSDTFLKLFIFHNF